MSIQLPLPFPPEPIWKDIPGFEGLYQVSDAGQVRRTKILGRYKPEQLSGTKVGAGYISVSLTIKKKSYTRSLVHRLVMLAFVGKCPVGIEVNHKNGIKTDNRLENLEYVTHDENMQHAKSIPGRDWARARGVESGRAKLNDEKVREIRALYLSGMYQTDIAKMYGVCSVTVNGIVRGRIWKHVK